MFIIRTESLFENATLTQDTVATMLIDRQYLVSQMSFQTDPKFRRVDRHEMGRVSPCRSEV
jgi:hypothetical protein